MQVQRSRQNGTPGGGAERRGQMRGEVQTAAEAAPETRRTDDEPSGPRGDGPRRLGRRKEMRECAQRPWIAADFDPQDETADEARVSVKAAVRPQSQLVKLAGTQG